MLPQDRRDARGYDSDSTLRYAFKAKTGMSMREWRKKEGIA